MTGRAGGPGWAADSPADPGSGPTVVIGAGAVGSFLATCLAVAGMDVRLVGRRARPCRRELVVLAPGPRRMEARVDDPGGLLALPASARTLVLAVKQFDVSAVLDQLDTRPPTVLVTVQNGVGAEEEVLRRLPGWPLVAASLTAPLLRVGPDSVHWLRRGGIALAPVHDRARPTAQALARAFSRAGLPSRLAEDWAAMKWSKLLLNLVGNATSALLGWEPGQVYAHPVAFAIERRQLLEALAVVRAARLPLVALPGADPRLLAVALRLPPGLARRLLAPIVARGRGGKIPSLGLATREADEGRTPPQSEVRWLNGAVVEAGRRLGVPTPVNAALWTLVEELVGNPGLRGRFADDPEALAATIGPRSPISPQ